jgi:hypothetical protein
VQKEAESTAPGKEGNMIHRKAIRENSLKEGTMLPVHPLLGNVLVNKFPQRQILGKQPVAR